MRPFPRPVVLTLLLLSASARGQDQPSKPAAQENVSSLVTRSGAFTVRTPVCRSPEPVPGAGLSPALPRSKTRTRVARAAARADTVTVEYPDGRRFTATL